MAFYFLVYTLAFGGSCAPSDYRPHFLHYTLKYYFFASCLIFVR